MGDIYISTLAFKNYTIEEITKIAKNEGLSIEFSSSFAYDANLVSGYKKSDINKMVHNYFPVPEVPFVLNLASADENIRAASVKHCIENIYLTKASAAPFFAAHAGFCVDPKPEELGKKIDYRTEFNKQEHLQIFTQSLTEILMVAEKAEVKFCFENNVITKFNMHGNINPLLCCESSEVIAVIRQLNHPNLGFLLDTAHLKVSCNTLGIDRDEQIKQLKPYITAIHHSDNDGLTDTNNKIDNQYWFLKHQKGFANIPQVIEVKNLSVPEIKEQISLLQNYGH
ncbi:sugar phosphate isomerase/epimerase family protein [Mucilaginibacter ximonensis]|uniref:Sugar phosphate isomerase/epimerase family protein n=1 Tax=Mucilaginibacter ximonensis TaxID=538021 RepID=A0ABW5YB38_9SPHI